eukprot:1116204-Pleurochrysis_carterae.AAC.2
MRRQPCMPKQKSARASRASLETQSRLQRRRVRCCRRARLRRSRSRRRRCSPRLAAEGASGRAVRCAVRRAVRRADRFVVWRGRVGVGRCNRVGARAWRRRADCDGGGVRELPRAALEQQHARQGRHACAM